MIAADPRVVMLNPRQVADRLGWSPKKVSQAMHATSPAACPPPMPGWKNVGTPIRPRYAITEAALIEYVNNLPEA